MELCIFKAYLRLYFMKLLFDVYRESKNRVFPKMTILLEAAKFNGVFYRFNSDNLLNCHFLKATKTSTKHVCLL